MAVVVVTGVQPRSQDLSPIPPLWVSLWREPGIAIDKNKYDLIIETEVVLQLNSYVKYLCCVQSYFALQLC